MMSFRGDRLSGECLSMGVVSLLAWIDEFKGKQQFVAQQSPQTLEALRHVAAVQSTESSNRIEGITVPEKRLQQIVSENLAPLTRPEGEVAGYRDVLATIQASHPHIRLSPGVILQFHRDMFRYVASEGGRWKHVDNTIDDVLPDGNHVVRFKTVSAVSTPSAVEELCNGYHRAVDQSDVLPLLAIAAFTLDFLCIHPFRDGNGRMSRLLSLLLLYQSGYDVGRYVSLERLIEQTKESYYESLAASSANWHEGRHSLRPWLEYFLGVIIAGYRGLEESVGVSESRRGAKSELVRRTVERQAGDFSIGELIKLCPSVSRETVRDVLEQMRAEGLVECLGLGRSARWRRAPAPVA